MEYYSAIKVKEILPLVIIWMGLEGITLSEISQREEDKYCMISLTCRIQKEKKTKTKTQQTHRYREQIDGCQRLGAGGDA